MNLVVVLEQRFEQVADASIWTPSVFSNSFWQRYLEVFDRVKVVARVRRVDRIDGAWHRVDGGAVSVVCLPHYIGPWEYLINARKVRSIMRATVEATDAVLLRVPSQIASALHPLLWNSNRPYGVEVVGDPYDTFAPGAVRHPLRPLFRRWFTSRLRRQCAGACAAAYVTERTLQRRYPPNRKAFTTHYSSIELPNEAIACRPRLLFGSHGRIKLITVGSLEEFYKGTDVLIDALANCVRSGVDIRLTILGDGRRRAMLEAKTIALGLSNHVSFLGHLPAGTPVRGQLDQADLFVLPSRQEGLPRAMIEAMARGLPCIGSAVGGIPELLPAEDLVPPGDAMALAAKIREVIADPERMARMSARNLAKAAEYREDVLRERRVAFYRYLREQTEAWIKLRGG